MRLLLFLIIFYFVNFFQSYAQNSMVKQSNAFALKLYQQIIKSQTAEKNIVFSPLSLNGALAMTYAGAKNETEKQFQEIIGFGENSNVFHRKYGAFLNTLQKDNAATQIFIANALWLQKDFQILEDFENTLKNYYKSPTQKVDFKNETEKAREQINDWVAKQTKESIKNLIPQGILNSLTKLVITNTLYLKATWQNPFEESLTKEDIFYAPQKEVKLPFMKNTKEVPYFENDIFESVVLYLNQDDYVTFIIPKDNKKLEEIENTINNSYYEEWFFSTADDFMFEEHHYNFQDIELYLPKFKLKKGLDFKEILIEMGLGLPFDEGGKADFSGITGEKDLVISDILQENFLIMNEKGVEAAAATAVVFAERSAPIKVKTLKLNRPFLFFICEGNTGAILFMGRFSGE